MMDEALHAAAASGNLEVCRALLEADDRPEANAPDSAGRSAIFYAQLAGHQQIANLLAFHGWTRMPEGNLHRGPGGRFMFWGAGEWGTSVPHMKVVALSPAQIHKLTREDDRHARRAPRTKVHARSTMDRLKENVVGKGHRLFARKQAGAGIYNSRRPKLPGLNTRDFAECHVLDDEMVLEETRAFIFSMYKDARTLIETQAHDGDDVVSTPSAAGEGRQRLEWTVGHVARFIVDRKPTQHADGSWVVLCPKTGPSNTVEPAYCVPLDECKEQKAVPLSAVPEASEAAWPPLPGIRKP